MRNRIAIAACVLALALAARAQEANTEAEAAEEAKLLEEARAHEKGGRKREALDLYWKIGGLGLERRHVDTAIRGYEGALALTTKAADRCGLLLNLGICEQVAKRLDRATAYVRRALATDPTSANAHNNLGYLLHLQGNDGEAFRCYARCLELDPKRPLARMTLGQIGRLVGETEKALAAHEELVAAAEKGDLAPGESWFYEFESKAGHELGKGVTFDTAGKRRALALVQVVIDLVFADRFEEALARMDAAKQAIGIEDLAPALQKGLDDVSRALELRPGHFQLRFALALMHAARGDDAKAKAEVERFVLAEQKIRAAIEKLQGK